MKLYYAPGACSLSPHIVAQEAGIPLELVKVDLKSHKTESGEDFYTINPKGYVPALKLDDGNMLTEGPAIVQYLADQKPASNLAPANGTFARYKLNEWLTFINSELHKNFGPLFSNPSDDVKKAQIEKIIKRFDYVNSLLGDKPFLLGDNFTVADAYLFVMLTWAQHLKVAVPDKLSAFFGRVVQRPNVHAAMKAEGLVK
jgi:glutathione S-transferase